MRNGRSRICFPEHFGCAGMIGTYTSDSGLEQDGNGSLLVDEIEQIQRSIEVVCAHDQTRLEEGERWS